MTAPRELAREWAHLEAQRLEHEIGLTNARTRLDSIRRRQEEISKDLRATLGPQLPYRLIGVDAGRVVMVSAAKGMELVEVETEEVSRGNAG